MTIEQLTRRTEWRVFVAVVVIVGLAATVYALRLPRWYFAQATLMDAGAGLINEQRVGRHTFRDVALSGMILQHVVERLTSDEPALMMHWQRPALAGTESKSDLIWAVIEENRQLVIDKAARTATFQVRSGDRLMAARIANLFMEEVIAYEFRVRIGGPFPDVEDLEPYLKEGAQTLKTITDELTAYREAQSQRSGKPFAADERSVALEAQQAEAQRRLDDVVQRERALRIPQEPPANPYRVLKRAVPPEEGEYLLTPILVPLAWGWGIAVLSGAGGGGSDARGFACAKASGVTDRAKGATRSRSWPRFT